MSSGLVQPLITRPHNSTLQLKAGAAGMVPGDPCHELEDRQMSDYKLLIDGKLVSGAMALNVVNPATEEVVAVAPRADRAQLESTGSSANRSPFKRAEFGSPIRMAVAALFIAAGIATASPVFAGTERGSQNMADTSDAALAASLPGDFRNAYAEVNGTRIHYVEGGKGTPVLLRPGWPQTWWEFHKIMPELAKQHRVIAVDLRGMGGSAKPGLGYDKKNMAKDIHELTQALGCKQVNIAGHDIGAMVAYSFAANYPDAT